MNTDPGRPLHGGAINGTPEVACVCAARRAVLRYKTQCFWYLRADLEITARDIPMIADGLRKNGGRHGFLLAAQLSR